MNVSHGKTGQVYWHKIETHPNIMEKLLDAIPGNFSNLRQFHRDGDIITYRGNQETHLQMKGFIDGFIWGWQSLGTMF